jgi:hypothetical protein
VASSDPDNDDGLEPEDVNISYAVHPWAVRDFPSTTDTRADGSPATLSLYVLDL